MDKVIAAIITLILIICVGLFFVIPHVMTVIAFVGCVLIVIVLVYIVILTIVRAIRGDGYI